MKAFVLRLGIVLDVSERERDCERVKRKLQQMCCRFYPFIFLGNRKEGLEKKIVDVAQIG